MQDRTITINAETLQNWKRPAEMLALIDAIKGKHPSGWLTSGTKVARVYHELYQGAIAYFGIEHLRQRKFWLHPSVEEPYDFFAAVIDTQKAHADYSVVQNKSVTDFNAVGTNNFQPGLLAMHIAKQIKRLAEPTLTFVVRLNANALVSPAALHAELLTHLANDQRPVWLYGYEKGELANNWFLQYIYPGYNEARKYDYCFGNLAPADDKEVARYMHFVDTFTSS